MAVLSGKYSSSLERVSAVAYYPQRYSLKSAATVSTSVVLCPEDRAAGLQQEAIQCPAIQQFRILQYLPSLPASPPILRLNSWLRQHHTVSLRLFSYSTQSFSKSFTIPVRPAGTGRFGDFTTLQLFDNKRGLGAATDSVTSGCT